MKNTNIKIYLAIASFIAAIAFGIAGIVIYPAGIIHGSVLILIAQLLVLTATLIGLNITVDLDKKFFQSKHQEESTNKEDIDQIKQIIKEQDEKEVEN